MAITLVVEDGSCPDGANTYASEALATSWASERGYVVWAGATDDEKAMALVQATDFLNQLTWIGDKIDEGRVFAWPRKGTVGVPAQVVSACCYLAVQINESGINPSTIQDRPLSSLQVGAISLEWEARTKDGPSYPALNGILQGLIRNLNVSKLVW